MKQGFYGGIAAGIMIGIGGSVFLACDNRYMGAILFTVALLSICHMGLSLYTGKVGFLVVSHKKNDIHSLIGCILGNLTGTFLCGLAVRLGRPSLGTSAQELVLNKLKLNSLEVLLTGLLCGVLMYTAVCIYREKNSISGILFCVPVFILAGFEHSIADMFYFFCAGSYSLRAALFVIMVIIGNSLGGMLIPMLRKLAA